MYDGVYPANTVRNKTLIYGKAVQVHKLKGILDDFLAQTDALSLIRNDPVEIVHEYQDPHDQEVVGLVVALLAYGRVRAIKNKVRSLISPWGASPAQAVANGTAAQSSEGFVYRFQKGSDLPRLLGAIRALRAESGSLAAAFAAGIRPDESDYAYAMDRFIQRLRGTISGEMTYGLKFLLPRSGETRGAAKRLCLYLRWMIRDEHVSRPAQQASSSRSNKGPAEARDLGTWQRLVPGQFDPAKLIIPLDTHIARISRYIGLTDQKSMGLKTAQDITDSLRKLCPADPLLYDMALCHLGISGECPQRRDLEKCSQCPIRGACRLGKTPRNWAKFV